MPSLITILILGFLLGMRHATDTDHVVAIGTITARQKSVKSSMAVGGLWGIGHSAMVTVVGILIIFLHLNIPARVGTMLEFSVGMMLVILGVINLFGVIKIPVVHKHEHSHREKTHSHLHFHFIRPLLVGSVHGLAGSAAIALLILATINNSAYAIYYLLIFNVGVIVGMMIITTLIGASLVYARNKLDNLNKYFVLGSGIISFVFGLYVMYQYRL
jgi:high-affinity nickel-transport protein